MSKLGHTPAETVDAIEYQWHSTPALWSAVRPGYDGGMVDYDTPSRDLIGFGRTQEEAAANLREQEDA